MRKGRAGSRLAALAVALLLLVPAAGLLAADEEASDITVKGEVLDMACYLGHGAHGADHQKCALKCAEMGQPIGLLGSDGKVYLLVADHADQSAFNEAKKMAGQNVTITGTAAGKDGINSLTVHTVAKS